MGIKTWSFVFRRHLPFMDCCLLYANPICSQSLCRNSVARLTQRPHFGNYDLVGLLHSTRLPPLPYVLRIIRNLVYCVLSKMANGPTRPCTIPLKVDVEQNKMNRPIDITFDFRTDTPEDRDPDALSPTLRSYHKILWSKPLPDGKPFDLNDTTRLHYLHHKSELGEFFLSSDTTNSGYRQVGHMQHRGIGTVFGHRTFDPPEGQIRHAALCLKDILAPHPVIPSCPPSRPPFYPPSRPP